MAESHIQGPDRGMTDLLRWPAAHTGAPLNGEALLDAMLRFEVALAHAQAEAGLIPAQAGAAIARAAAGFTADAAQTAREAAHAGSPAIVFVRALTAHVAAHDADAAAWVHFGATSQDLVDTALVLCLQQAVAAIDDALGRGGAAAAQLAQRHAEAPMLARTLLQPAGIITIGYKAAHWARSLAHVRERLAHGAQDALALSLGGAVGTLAAFGDRGDALRAALARELGLRDVGASWHAQREQLAGLAADAGVAAGALRKIAGDLALLSQAEVAEAQEPAADGRGGSSAMPHKRNPVLCLRVLANTQAAPGLVAALLSGMDPAHERGLGDWQAESASIQTLFEGLLAAASALAELLEGVRFDTRRCRENIEATRGLVFSEALAALLLPRLGRTQAQTMVGNWCTDAVASGAHLRDVVLQGLSAEPSLLPLREQIEAVFDLEQAARPAARLARSAR